MRRASALALLLPATLAAAGLASRPVVNPSATASRVLFIGNSLTAANGLPRAVQTLSAGALAATEITRSNYSLEDHWNAPEARAAIARGGWSAVVLQQGPSALPESRVLLRDYTRRFDREIRKSGARTALYMVWPSEQRSRDFDAVYDSYASAAADVQGLFLPAGDAWRAAWRRDPSLALYDTDRFHPSRAGTYLAAVVIAARLTGRTPGELSRAAVHASLLPGLIAAPARVALLHEAAAEAIAAASRRSPLPQ